MPRRALVVLLIGLAGALGWAEFVHWRSSGRRLGSGSGAGGTEAVVVLGFRNRGSRANSVNRYRVRAGLRSIDPRAERSVLVLCGGAVGGEVPEARLMLRYARERRGYSGPIQIDDESRSTRENVHNAIPLVEHADRIKLVSNSLHAEVARAHLWEVRPDLARRLVRAEEHRLGEILWLKPLAALLGLQALRRLRPE